MIAFTLLLITTASFAQKNHTNKRQQKMKAALARYHDNIDNRMKGPNGEMIYMSPNGGRYYIKNDKKIYIEYKGNKK
ncbi:MAG: hypothetical protein JWN83_2499 [Chitinophagaceae bacterium]|nr:hypothetical protein [Chitinophagaceae bacterium]